MSITDVNTTPGLTPVSYPNQAFTNIVNPDRHVTIIMKPAAILYVFLHATNKRSDQHVHPHSLIIAQWLG